MIDHKIVKTLTKMNCKIVSSTDTLLLTSFEVQSVVFHLHVIYVLEPEAPVLVDCPLEVEAPWIDCPTGVTAWMPGPLVS